jgi:hypothetical protein
LKYVKTPRRLGVGAYYLRTGGRRFARISTLSKSSTKCWQTH